MNDYGIKISPKPSLKYPYDFSYTIPVEQLSAFAKLTDSEKLQWVDDARLFTLMTQTPETKARHELLRKGNNQSVTSK